MLASYSPVRDLILKEGAVGRANGFCDEVSGDRAQRQASNRSSGRGRSTDPAQGRESGTLQAAPRTTRARENQFTVGRG